MRSYTSIFVFLCITRFISAQDIMPKQELALQSQFIEAKKYALIGDYAKAQSLYESLYDKNKSNAQISFELAKLHRELGNYNKAYDYADLTLKRDSNNEHYQDVFGEIALEANKTGEAIEVFQKLHNKHPKNELYGDKLASAYKINGNYKEAIRVYDELEDRVGISKELSREKIEMYKLIDDHQSIEKELLKLVEYEPEEKLHLQNLASFYTARKRKKDAQEVYQKILKMDETDATANLALINTSIGSTSDNDYILALTPIIENPSISIDRKVLELLPYVEDFSSSNDKELGSALETITDRLRNAHPQEAKAYAIYGDVLMLNNHLDAAINAYEKTLTLNNNIYSVYDQLMYAYLQKGEMLRLKELSEEAMDYFPNQATAYLYQGQALLALDEKKDAVEVLEEGVLVATGNTELQAVLYTVIGEVLIKSNKKVEAKENLEKALAINPDNVQAKKFIKSIK